MIARPTKARRGPSLWELARAEFRLNVRTPGFKVAAILLSVATLAAVWVLPLGAPGVLRMEPMTVVAVRGALEAILLLLAPLMVCAAAVREHRLGMDELLLSKPSSSETLIWGKFGGIFGAQLALAGIAIMAAWAGQCVLFREYSLWPALLGGLRIVPSLLFLCGLAFCLAITTNSATIGGLVVALRIAIGFGSDFLMPVLRFTLTPYHTAYGLLGLAFVALTAATWQQRRNSARTVPLSWALAGLFLIGGLTSGVVAANHWRGWGQGPDAKWEQLAAQKDKKLFRLPTISMDTLDGRSVRLSQWEGHPVILVFWSTFGGGAAEAAALERAWRASAPTHVQFASVCITNDAGTGLDMARAVGLETPVLWNPPSENQEAQGLAVAFGIIQDPQMAFAVVVGPAGSVVSAPVSQFSYPPRGHAPHHDWESILIRQGTLAFRQLAERSR